MSEPLKPIRTESPAFGTGLQFALIGFGLAAPLLTFWIAVSDLSADLKVTMLVSLSVIYVIVCIRSVIKLRQAAWVGQDSSTDRPVSAGNADLSAKLAALDDAREFFGNSLKPADMFRLVSTRVQDLLPFSDCLLLTPSGPDTFRIHNTFGPSLAGLDRSEVVSPSIIAGVALLSGETETTSDLSSERELFTTDGLQNSVASAALPLRHEGEVFAVYQLFFDSPIASGPETVHAFEKVAERVAPLFLGALAFESSLSRALTDPLTNLPNERAFYMVLENQLAESQRFRDERPLTILAIDIQNFDELNSDHGHAFGDNALNFASKVIASQLRKMDFLSRSMNDEFLVILPKASERTANEIVSRIRLRLADSPIQISESESVKLWLNFGFATFWKDGETVDQLVRNAYLRKQQTKSADASRVLAFPKEYVN